MWVARCLLFFLVCLFCFIARFCGFYFFCLFLELVPHLKDSTRIIAHTEFSRIYEEGML